MLVILLKGAKYNTGSGRWNNEFMSLRQTKYLQGFLALCIMLHHVGQETCAEWQRYKLLPGLEFFVPIGYLFVAVFFMCSGYGLFKSYMTKENYLQGFFKKRVLPMILGFYISNWVFFIARIIMKEKMTGWKIFCNISGWGMPNLYAWFALIMPLFYVFFYLSFRFLKTDGMRLLGVIVLVFIFTFIGTNIDHNDYWMRGEWWYNSGHLFWMGILFAMYEKKITEFIKKRYGLWCFVFVVGAYVLFKISYNVVETVSYYGQFNPTLTRFQVVENRWICLASQMAASTFFVAAVLIICMKLQLGNKVLGFMGGITMEFYLMHGLFLELFSYKFCDITPSITRIENVALLVVVVTALSIPASLLLKKLIHIFD